MKVVFPVTNCRREEWYIVGLGQGYEEKAMVRYCIQK